MMDLKVFGLLHFAESEQSAMNVSTKNFRDQISIYIKNALVLSRSLENRGIKFSLITNDKCLVESFGADIGKDFSLDVVEIPFETKVPSGVRFYSAHYKIDVYRYLSQLPDAYYAFCDLDVVCVNRVPVCFSNIVEERVPLFYDISDQVIPAYGHDVIIKDLSLLGKIKSEGRWSGGEFISGAPEFFSDLVCEIDKIYDEYVKNIQPALFMRPA